MFGEEKNSGELKSMGTYDDALRPLLLEAERKNRVDASVIQRIWSLVADFEHDKDIARQTLHRGLATLMESLTSPNQPPAPPLNGSSTHRPIGHAPPNAN